LLGELDELAGVNASITNADRIEQYGHPKEFIEKLYKSCV
jgi:CRP-like cAMP-binding protein